MKCACDCSPTKAGLTLAGLSLQCQIENGSIPQNLPSHCGKFESIIVYFSQFSLIVLIMHVVLALACKDMRQSAIAGRLGLIRAMVNRILRRHAATVTLVPDKSTGAPRKTTHRQDRALLRMVRQDRFISVGALTAQMRNFYGMRAGQKTINNRLLFRGHRAYRSRFRFSFRYVYSTSFYKIKHGLIHTFFIWHLFRIHD